MSVTVKVFAGFMAGALSGYIGHMVVKIENGQSEQHRRPREDYRDSEILKYGKPKGFPDVVIYRNHALHYDQARKIPVWVMEHITPGHIKGSANRKHSKFRPDPILDELFTATNKDFWHSGWSRGHMNPAADNKFDQKAMDESFYLTNVLPQDIKNNGDFWNRLEIYCRDLTKTYPSVRVISGPLMVSHTSEDGHAYITHQVIGEREVAVPTHLYKVILVENNDGQPQAIASFVVPNQNIPKDHSLTQYQVPLEFIERRVGYRLLPALNDHSLSDLCTMTSCKLMSDGQLQLYFMSSRLANATTLERLEKDWMELEKRHIKPDQYTIDLYNNKKLKLSEKKDAADLK